MPPPSLAMAGMHRDTTFFLLPFANATPIPRKPLFSASSFPTPFPSKLTKRKNYLRPKLLKTLTKPYPNPLLPDSPPTNPIIPIDPLLEQQPESLPSDQFSGATCPRIADEEPKESEAQVSETTGVSNGDVRRFSTRLVLNFGLYLVGAFVFHTICAVWVLGSASSDHKDGYLDSEDKTRVLELGVNGNNKAKSKFLFNGKGNLFHGKLRVEQGGIVYADESELEDKIFEIQEMARNARERERLESKANGLDDDDVFVKTGIEKEVDSRLVKLRKRLQSIRDKSPVSSISYLSKDGKVEDGVDKDGLDAKEANEELIFKKKYRFRSPSTDPSNKPKGFMGSEDHSVTMIKSSSSAKGDEVLSNGNIGNNGVELLDKDRQLDPQDGLRGSVSMSSEEDDGRRAPKEQTKSMRNPRKKLVKERGRTKLAKEMKVAKTEPKTGIPQETSYERPSVQALKSGESSKLEASFTNENHDTATIVNKSDVSSRNDSLKSKVGGKRSANKVGDEKSDSETESDLWWLSLPYVLTILMRRGRDGEGPQGLFALKSISHTKGDSSHTIAFEDRGDATNFCYLLQSFFEDLGDFSTDIVPLSIKELDEAVKSHTMKVLVLKKGQLQLYVGQPLADVEMALHSLVGQS